MCGSKLRCACGTHFGSNLGCACVRCILRLAKCDRNITHYFGNKERNWLSFGISYNFVAQKWRILEFFYKKINFGSYWDLKQCLKAKIINQVLLYNKVAVASCDHQKSKLRAVAVADGFWVAELQVRQVKIGSKSCFAKYSQSIVFCST
jgi:hypothetical protein